ncbi:MAG: hypothetical protein JXQ29_11265 [Planctomycetes bacterium]|nr:hypothetical protein [Planctomycetota bacterium]
MRTNILLFAGILLLFGMGRAGAQTHVVTNPLPGFPVLYARLLALPRATAVFRASGLEATVLELLGKPETPRAGQAADWSGAIDQLHALHIGLYVGTSSSSPETIQAILVAELSRTVDLLKWLPAAVAQNLVKELIDDATTLYRLEYEVRGLPQGRLWFATMRERVIMSTCPTLAKKTVDRLRENDIPSLARDTRFQTVTRNWKEHDVQVFLSCAEVLRLYSSRLEERKRIAFLAAVDAWSIDDISYLCGGWDYDDSKMDLRAAMNEQSLAYLLLAQPATEKKIPAFLPRNTFVCFAHSIRDGRELWKRLSAFCENLLVRTGSMKDAGEYREFIDRAEQEVGVRFDDLAALAVEEGGVFLTWEPEGDCTSNECEFSLFNFLKDATRGQELFRKVVSAVWGEEERTQDVCGVVLHTPVDGWAGGMTWGIIDNCLLHGVPQEVVKQGVLARKSGRSLGEQKAFQEIVRRLHPKNAYWAYADLGILYEGCVKSRSSERTPMRGLVQGLVAAASVTVENGVFDARVVWNKNVTLGDIFGLVRKVLEDTQSRRPVAR